METNSPSATERVVGFLSRLKLRRMDRMARLSGTAAAGVIVAVVGAIVAVVALFGLVFLPVATFPTIDAEMAGIIGLAMAIFGGALAAIDK